MHQFKAKDSATKPYTLFIGNILKDFTIEKTELKEYVHTFSVDYNIVNSNNILDIHRYIIKIT